MNNTVSVNPTQVQQWLEKKLDTDSVRNELISYGYDSDTIDAHLKEYVRLKNTKKQNTGFVLLAAGALIGFISCVLTILNPVPSLHDLFLYGLTSVSIIVLCGGLYLVFE